MNRPIRVLLIDDDAIFRLGVESILKDEENIKLVGQADTGEYALSLLSECKPDILLVDLHLGPQRLSGPTLIKEIKKQAPSLACISLTIEKNPFLLLQMIDAGTSAIIRKNRINTIKESIVAVHNGEHIIQSDIAYSIIKALKERQILERLSPNEFDTFQRIGLGENDLTIAKELGLSKSSIKSRLVTIKRKLNVDTKADLIQLYLRFFPWSKNT